MMDRIMAMRTFVRIVDANSFTRAANSLGIPRASATTLLQSLEEMLGIQLLVRTTRRLNLTAEGAAYYERCVRILADIDDIEASRNPHRIGERCQDAVVQHPGSHGCHRSIEYGEK